jgi:5-methylcytosine-specific restriction endonuclease McrA
MSRVTFDSREYHRARREYDGHCLGCGAPMQLSLRLILTKSGELRQSYPPNSMMCCGEKCLETFLANSITSWGSVRREVLRRDGHTCQDCGLVARKIGSYQTEEGLEVHHIQPVSEGGPEFDEENCVTLCHACHVGPQGRHSRAVRIARKHICLERFAEAMQ